jgi:hypothetical protein
MKAKGLLHPLVQAHFHPVPLDDLVITERAFPARIRADLQRATEQLLAELKPLHSSGVRRGAYGQVVVTMADLLIEHTQDPPMAAPAQFEEVDVGEEQPVRCLRSGLWLLDGPGARLAVLMQPAQNMRPMGVSFQVAAGNTEAGRQVTQRFFKHLEETVLRAPSYRGKILSLEWQTPYAGIGTGLKVHRLQQVRREDVILPRATLELLERNVIQFIRRRPELTKLGLPAKKGVLFYGPPGTGKTHTLHYLFGELKGVTTFLVTAEQQGLLGEYVTLARLLQPSTVVLEDADLIARQRGAGINDEVLLNQLLNEMDGLREDADVLFVLTTNRPEVLEPALASRPGRIDQAIEFPYPDDEGRAKLLRLYARGLPLSDELVRATVRRTERVSAAFIKELMRRAAQFRLERGGTDGLLLADVDSALEEMLFRGGSLNQKLLGCAGMGFGAEHGAGD